MIRQKKRTPAQNKDSDRMMRAVARYLEKNGWSVLVAGPPRVQQEFSLNKFNFEFVLPFTGGRSAKARGQQ